MIGAIIFRGYRPYYESEEMKKRAKPILGSLENLSRRQKIWWANTIKNWKEEAIENWNKGQSFSALTFLELSIRLGKKIYGEKNHFVLEMINLFQEWKSKC